MKGKDAGGRNRSSIRGRHRVGESFEDDASLDRFRLTIFMPIGDLITRAHFGGVEEL